MLWFWLQFYFVELILVFLVVAFHFLSLYFSHIPAFVPRVSSWLVLDLVLYFSLFCWIGPRVVR